ncbi:IclR family transcriptional regulator [Falsiroseomonas bella]|uniref:IclR family transcriptional regulator n=1 Tax=Falsiroseomonas bella TaxID=2184016 RepID=A0A317FF46_9PROT|nr:IclR family transcriptional regulator C-terminal domain-containing protein [Falsiroseomonas bella]PWS37711.1 IclR family transcriptional regulator [Falsiroseomonas bella]
MEHDKAPRRHEEEATSLLAEELETDLRAGADRELVHSVLRLFEVLKAFRRERPRMTLSEVAEYAGLTRASARRFLLTLVHAGYAETDGKRFALTPRLLELGHAVMAGSSVWDVARPVLEALSEKLGESCYGAVLDGAEVLYVLHIPSSRHLINVDLRVGSRTPAYCTSVGRVLLAGLTPAAAERVLAAGKPESRTPKTVTAKGKLLDAVEQARRQGWSIVDEELELGLRSLSVPLRGRGGVTVGAINVCGPTSRVSLEELRTRFLGELLEAASRIQAAIE